MLLSNKKSKHFVARIFISLVFTFVLIFPFVANAQTAEQTNADQTAVSEEVVVTQVSIGWRIMQIIAFAGTLIALAGLIYGIVLWRSGTQNNDVILVDRGRRIALMFGIVFIIFAILLIVTFIVIKRQQERSVIPPPAISQPIGASGLVTKDALLLIEMIPLGEVPIRNVNVQLVFNQPISPVAIDKTITIINQSDQSEVLGEWTVEGEFVVFKPNTTCPSPNTGLRCFDENTTFDVTIFPELTSIDGDEFKCATATPGQACKFSFTTGDQIDVKPPTVAVTIPFEDAGVPVDSNVVLEALAVDDFGVSTIHFYVDDTKVGISSISGGDLTPEFRGSSNWETLDLLVKSNHTVSAKSIDLAGFESKKDSVGVEILPIYCFDGVQNEDESGLDCGGPTCRACQGSECTENSQCASGLCFENVCQEFPVIKEVVEDNGAVGNYITIRGNNFGINPGKVLFLGEPGDGDDVEAPYPQCAVFWGNQEVVIEVPNGAKTGPIKITTADNLYDTTDDNKGLQLNFEVNNVNHPGLCAINPSSQVIGESVVLQGSGFGEELGDVLFGKFSAGRISGWSNNSISEVTVPSLEPAELFVKVKVGDDYSNPVIFKVLSSPTLPLLTAITPDKGPIGQMFSLSGENLAGEVLVKFYDPNTGKETLADTRLPASCLKLQSPNQRAYRVPRLEPGTYQVYAENNLGRSNNLNFVVNQGERLPGLCGMAPDNGPLGIEITFYGEGFGSATGGIRFTPRNDDAVISGWSDGSVSATVPPNAQTGPVQIIHSNGALSNPMTYTIGQCSPDLAKTGFECCSDGSYKQAGSCIEEVPFCTYSWLFSTGDDLGGPPRVIEDASCKTTTQSPSPFKDTKDGCINASISARFTHDMSEKTLNTDNIVVRKCNSGKNFNSSECQSSIVLSSLKIINSGQPGEGFLAVPQLQLSPDTWYRVELSDQIQAENGLFLVSPYSWVFKSQEGEGLCEVDHVEVTPPNAILRKLREFQDYTGVPTALNCNILNPEAFSWHWLSSDTSKASIIPTTNPTTKAISVGPTEPGPPVEILGGIPDVSKEDKGLLSVLLLSPTVVSKWPACSATCVNAGLGAKFDQEMDASSVTNLSNVQLYLCADPTCARVGLSNVGAQSVKYNETNFEIYFLPAGGSLKAGASYRVVLNKGIKSSSTMPLGGLNYDLTGDGVVDGYSWKFKVQDSSDLCAIDHVNVSPPFGISYLIPDDSSYFGLPISPPDSCNQNGQILNPESYDWTWKSGNVAIGNVSTLDNIRPEGFIDPYQVTTSAGAGETKISASALGVAGEGDYSVICGYTTDNDCPSPATVSSHGVGKDTCCHARPEISSLNPKDGSDSVCTTLATEVHFTQYMDELSLSNNVKLQYNNGTTPCANSDTTAWNRFKNLANNIWRWIIPETSAQATNWCEVDSSIKIRKSTTGSIAQLFPQEELDNNTQFRVVVTGDLDLSDGVSDGVKNFSGVPMSGDFTSTFTTGEAECSLDVVEVVINPPDKAGSKDVFFCAIRNDCEGDTNLDIEGNQHTYTAIGRDLSGYMVPGEYSWNLSGLPLISLDTTVGEVVEVTTGRDNGESVITVIGNAVAPSKGRVSRSIDVKVFICENPWPSIEGFPYVDLDFHWDIFYCRDYGDPGTHDDLPPLSFPIIDANVGETLQESLFIVE